MASYRQIPLFDCPTLAVVPQAESQNLTYEELWTRFKAEYESARLYPRNPVLVEIPQSEAIAEMGRRQVQRFSTSQRLRQDCDRISIMGKVAWSLYLGEPAHKVFDDWRDALGKGNKGIFWSIPGENVGLRTTGGLKDEFTFSRNKHGFRITAMAFARVQLQHTGSAYVELLGWAHRHRMGDLIRDRGQFLSVKLSSLQRNGLLLTPADFRQQFLDCV
ncbi:MAG: hypothetical protein K0Q50_1160 [Vampirovibrio sp.]|jgi:hypothetical protein|nr:hypothetical protein [Vampirovibrio sp.]